MRKHLCSTLFVLVAGVATAMFVTGCASSGQASATDDQSQAYSDGMMCPECETVWVANRNRFGARSVTRLSYEQKMTCPKCDEMAQSQLLEDGQVMLHECPMCKVTLKQIQPTARPKHFNPRP